MAQRPARRDIYRPTNLLTDPFRRMEELLRESPLAPFLGSMDEGLVRLDIEETDQAYTIHADMPGIKKDDIKVTIDGNRVSLSATTQGASTQQTGNMMCRERHTGELFRSVTLPHEIDESTADAAYQDGVLHLTLPKRAGGASKQIAVH